MSENTETHEVLAIQSLRLPPSLIAELRAVADENDRSLSYQARVALREWLDQTKESR